MVDQSHVEPFFFSVHILFHSALFIHTGLRAEILMAFPCSSAVAALVAAMVAVVIFKQFRQDPLVPLTDTFNQTYDYVIGKSVADM